VAAGLTFGPAVPLGSELADIFLMRIIVYSWKMLTKSLDKISYAINWIRLY